MDIFEAVLRNDDKALKHLIEVEGVSLASVTIDDQTVAHIAVKSGNLPMLKYLLDKDDSLLAVKDTWDQSVLHVAAGKGEFDIVKYLINERNMDPNIRAKRQYGNTILHIAARNGHLDLVKYFIESKRFSADEKNEVGEPPLFLAAENIQLNVVKYLVEEQNANTTALDNNEDNILFVSAKNGDLSVPRYLIDERNVEYDVKWRDYLGDTILHRAAWYDNVDFLKYFIEEKKADIDHTDTFNRTAVYMAVFRSQTAAMKYLAEHGANLEIADKLNHKPIDITRDSRIISYLQAVMSKRNRRSLTAAVLSQLPQKFGYSFSSKYQISVGDQTQVDRSLSGPPTPFERALSSPVDGLLSLANVFVRYACSSTKSRRVSNHFWPSPIEILEDEIDPAVLDSLNSETHAFERRS